MTTAAHAAHLSPAYSPRASPGTAERARGSSRRSRSTRGATRATFLTVATPGAGKTTLRARLAGDLLDRRVVDRIIVVAPTEHLKTQWAQAARASASRSTPDFSGARHDEQRLPRHRGHLRRRGGEHAAVPPPRGGPQDARDPRRGPPRGRLRSRGRVGARGLRARDPALAPHGYAVPLRHQPDPVRHHAPGPDGIPRSAADTTYGYGRRLRDNVVRPVMFLAYSGRCAGARAPATRSARVLGADQAGGRHPAGLAHRARPAGRVDPAGAVRRGPPPHRGAQARARRRRPSSSRPTTPRRVRTPSSTQALTGQAGRAVRRPEGGEKITAFSASDERWMVAVRMVSEGVDVPPSHGGVYALDLDPLFFAQAVGCFVAPSPRRDGGRFLPSVRCCCASRASFEGRRDHARSAAARRRHVDGGGRADRAGPPAARHPRPPDDDRFTGASESEATFDRVLFGDDEFGAGVGPGTVEERRSSSASPARRRPGDRPCARAARAPSAALPRS